MYLKREEDLTCFGVEGAGGEGESSIRMRPLRACRAADGAEVREAAAMAMLCLWQKKKMDL